VKISIVGAGISGLATAQAILSRMPDAEIAVFESSKRIGGKVWTERSLEGFLCEGGVNGFLNKIPETLQLCDELGLTPLAADVSAQKRYVFSQDELHKLPEKPPEFLASRLLSVPGRLRVLYEMVAGGTDKEDESLADFATRRLGREASDKLIDPMASGVFAGDSDKLSLKSCFPRIHEVEAEYGSLIRGLIKLQLKARREGKKKLPGAGPGGTLTSFGRGMGEMTDALAQSLGSRIHIGAPVRSVSRISDGYTLHFEDGPDRETERLVLAVPAYVQSEILQDLDPALGELLGTIPYPALSVVCLGYSKNRIGTYLDGFGFLVPSKEKRSILGTIVDSNVFPNRAPEGAVLFRSMVGGARTPHVAELPDEQLTGQVLSDLKDITGLSAEPEFVRIFRHQRAIPQYNVGGNALRGVSLNDCVVNARRTAERLIPDPERIRNE
jgi:oxygen-dependent protoporphyrinogen oxidase